MNISGAQFSAGIYIHSKEKGIVLHKWLFLSSDTKEIQAISSDTDNKRYIMI